MKTPIDFLPGDIFWTIDNDGERHPAIVVSRPELNRGDYVIVVPATSTEVSGRRLYPNNVLIERGQFGLSRDCVVQAEGMTVMEKTELDLAGGRIGNLNQEYMSKIIKAIGHVISAKCMPS